MKRYGSSVLFALMMLWMVCVAASFLITDREAAGLEVFPEATKESEHASEHMVRLLQDDKVTELDMESYLTGVLLLEMPPSFHPQAKQAQAVAARTFALKMEKQSYRHDGMAICDDPGCCQGYISVADYLDAGGDQDAVTDARSAVRATEGMVITYEGELIDATYFSCSGGKTEDAIAVWGSEIPYLHAVESPGEEDAQWYTDTVVFTALEFQNKLGWTISGNPTTWFGPVEYTNGGGVKTIDIGGRTYTGTVLRSILGLRSSCFTITTYSDRIIIQTKGYGHRVGLSQYGADAMARNGMSWQAILLHYYQGVDITMQMDEIH